MKSTKIIYLLIQFLFIAAITHAQKHEIDSVNSIDYGYIVSNLSTSLELFTKNLNKARELGYRSGEAKALSKLSLINYLQGNTGESASNQFKAIKIFEEMNDFAALAKLYGDYGYQIKRIDLKAASNYIRLGIKTAEENNLKIILAGLYDHFGVTKEMGNELDSALFYYKKSLKLKYELNDTLGIPYSLNNIAGIFIVKGNYKEAAKFLNVSDNYRNKEKGDFGKAQNLSLRGDLYDAEGKVDFAIDSYKKCLALSKGLNFVSLTQFSYNKLSELYLKKNDYKNAFENFRNYTSYKDSISNIEIDERIMRLQISYEAEKKDRQIAENKLAIKNKDFQIFILIGAVALMVIVSGGIYKYQKQKRERIKTELEFRNQLNNAEMENKLSSEKLRISRELHDNIGSKLTFIISSLDNLTYKSDEENIFNRLNSVSQYGRETLSELRNTIWAIKHESGTISDLILKINDIIQKINSNIDTLQIILRNNISGTYNLSSTQMLNIYRIIQEAVQNAVKYSDADKMFVEFFETAQGFSITIGDNGKGFDINKVSAGNGLKNMEMRCKEAAGVFLINSDTDGTKILCEFRNNQADDVLN